MVSYVYQRALPNQQEEPSNCRMSQETIYNSTTHEYDQLRNMTSQVKFYIHVNQSPMTQMSSLEWKRPPKNAIRKYPQSCQTQKKDQVENHEGHRVPLQKLKKDHIQ